MRRENAAQGCCNRRVARLPGMPGPPVLVRDGGEPPAQPAAPKRSGEAREVAGDHHRGGRERRNAARLAHRASEHSQRLRGEDLPHQAPNGRRERSAPGSVGWGHDRSPGRKDSRTSDFAVFRATVASTAPSPPAPLSGEGTIMRNFPTRRARHEMYNCPSQRPAQCSGFRTPHTAENFTTSPCRPPKGAAKGRLQPAFPPSLAASICMR